MKGGTVMHTIEIKQPLGYQVEIITEKTDIFKARKILSTRKQHRYTSAIRNDGKVEMKRHILICPYCGERTPAYPRFFSNTNDYKPINKIDIKDWSTDRKSVV